MGVSLTGCGYLVVSQDWAGSIPVTPALLAVSQQVC